MVCFDPDVMRVEVYKCEMSGLLRRRAASPLKIEEEAEIAERLDDLWRAMSPDDHRNIEAWLSRQLNS